MINLPPYVREHVLENLNDSVQYDKGDETIDWVFNTTTQRYEIELDDGEKYTVEIRRAK